MTNQNQIKQDHGKNGFNPVVAAVAGAVVGAGVAVAGAVALNDEKNREKIKVVLTNVKDHAVNYVEDVQKQVLDKKEKVDEKFADGNKKVQKLVNSAKKAGHTK